MQSKGLQKLDGLNVCATEEEFSEYVALFHVESYAAELNTLKLNCKVKSWKVIKTFEIFEQGGNGTVVSFTPIRFRVYIKI